MSQIFTPGLHLEHASNPALAMSLIAAAKTFMRRNHIDQWRDDYPAETHIRLDMAAGKGYFAIKDGICAAYLCIDAGPEPAYAQIDGAWLRPGSDYGLAHRLAVNPLLRGQGIGKAALILAADKLMKMGKKSFRIDTDAANGAMRHILLSLGFKFCGKIRFQNSEKLAFEKLF